MILRNQEPGPRKLSTPAAAIAVAHELAAGFARTAVARDRDHRLPHDEVAALIDSGLLGIGVPTSHGGADVNMRSLAQIIRIIATADPGIAIIPQSHFNLVESVRDSSGNEDLSDFVYREMLAGHLFGNAAVERDAPSLDVLSTRLVHGPDGIGRVSGRKFYTTGSMFATWIIVLARDQATGRSTLCIVDRHGPGVEVLDDWRASGQRSAACGSVVLTDAPILPGFSRSFNASPDRTVPWAQILHAAVQVGIARGALRDLMAFVRDEARPWIDSRADRVSEEDYVIRHVGMLEIQVAAAEAYLDRAAVLTDAVRHRPGEKRLTAARIAVAGAKSFGTEVALKVGSAVLELGGTRAAMEEAGLDRHWRNAQTQASHNQDRWLHYHVGNHVMNGVALPKNGKI